MKILLWFLAWIWILNSLSNPYHSFHYDLAAISAALANFVAACFYSAYIDLKNNITREVKKVVQEIRNGTIDLPKYKSGIDKPMKEMAKIGGLILMVFFILLILRII